MTELLTPKDVSEILRVSVATLANWRSTKRYDLPYIKLGKVIRYRIEDVQDFIDLHMKGNKNSSDDF